MRAARLATPGSTTIAGRFGAVAALLCTFALGCDGASEAPSSQPSLAASSDVSGSNSSPNERAGGSGAAAGAGASPAIPAATGGASTGAGQPEPRTPSGGAGSRGAAADGGGVAMSSRAGAGGSPEAGDPAADGPSQPSAAGTNADTPPLAPAQPDYLEIIASDWEIAPGDETYLCLRKTAEADLRINQFRTVLPTGTHHVGLFVSPTPDKADGTIGCGLLETGDREIVGGGPGADGLSLPPGVALRFDKGNQLLLQLHLFNPTDRPLRGRSSVEGVVLPQDEVKAEADVLSAQLLALVIPPGRARASGRCTFDRAQTLVAFGAHMHETGRHAKVVLHRAKNSDQVLRDGDYDFTEQRRYPLDLVEVAAGDYVDYECTYENTTDRTINWGESSLDEMCLFNFYRFPAGGPTLCVF